MRNNESGFALITVFLLITVLTALAGSYLVMTRSEILLARSSKESSSGFNAAEAGLNLRAGFVKRILDNFDDPTGISPTSVEDCDNGTLGSGDYQCQTYDLNKGFKAVTFVTQEASNPLTMVVPPGLPFQGLNAIENRYTVHSVGRGVKNNNQALLGLTFRARSVPLFQFAIFFEEDLEFFNGNTMIVDGPVHGNSDIYLASQDGDGSLSFNKQLTTANDIYRGRKNVDTCSGYTSTVRAYKNTPSYVNFSDCSSSTTRYKVEDVSAWEDKVLHSIGQVKVPEMADIDAFSDGPYWQKADLRLVLKLNSSGQSDTSFSTTGVVVMNADNSIDTAATLNLNACSGLVNSKSIGSTGDGSSGNNLRLFREKAYADSVGSAVSNYERTLEIDTRNLLDCLDDYPSIIDSKPLNESSNGGLVFFFTIDGNLSASSHNNYSVRIRNSARLRATSSGAPLPLGLTVVSDQRIVIWGDYNSNVTDWISASIISDSLYLLSNSWQDSDSEISKTEDRIGNATTVRAAVLTGIARTGGENGVGGQDKGESTNGGGVINIFRFNEWFRDEASGGDVDFVYDGSMVSLGAPRRSQSLQVNSVYSAPNRTWSYDERFNIVAQLPPLTPRFTYLTQDLFTRDYE